MPTVSQRLIMVIDTGASPSFLQGARAACVRRTIACSCTWARHKTSLPGNGRSRHETQHPQRSRSPRLKATRVSSPHRNARRNHLPDSGFSRRISIRTLPFYTETVPCGEACPSGSSRTRFRTWDRQWEAVASYPDGRRAQEQARKYGQMRITVPKVQWPPASSAFPVTENAPPPRV